jgi:hypothetical protein
VTLNIESIDYEDIETLVRYGIHFWDLTPYKDQFEYNPDTVRELVTHVADDHYLRVVRCDGEIVGFIGFLLHPFIFSNLVQQATEVFFYVHPSYRKEYNKQQRYSSMFILLTERMELERPFYKGLKKI